ncbi:LOW QUALITY PROTEIN: G2/M phase-specific E3 ubiquitin-protein ligase-like [Bombina bombina]|uniref:LOW QUALITY PROTEIN: G2/M phase-specific E3 ubiquitin-protein ligase-like n=1 Tax=Bombina bombina TaxID=8345 RepID=UPI00235AE31D|nr:LOW QUALITY PROTEIN: G2/M phase-specific E3 ubiquitin-protein ligase-like [Bombina bombina]
MAITDRNNIFQLEINTSQLVKHAFDMFQEINTLHVQMACVFCGRVEDKPEKYGEKLTDKKTNISVHYYCLILSSGLLQQGEEKDGFYGFLVNSVTKEVKRASKLTCTVCKEKGASIRCCKTNCRKIFHFPCGQGNQCLFQYFDRFESFCWQHRPVQNVPSEKKPAQCSICLQKINSSPTFIAIKSPCCSQSWFHRKCLQKHALSAGLYFFNCPTCNNKTNFQSEMLRMGIHIPQRDASWEREENAYQELHEVYQRCDVKKCLCDLGRDYVALKGKWCIVRCHYCGSMGTHLICSALENKKSQWTCPECFSILHGQKNQEMPLRRKKIASIKSGKNLSISTTEKGSENNFFNRNKTNDKSGPSTDKGNSSSEYNNHQDPKTGERKCYRVSSRRNRRKQVRTANRKRLFKCKNKERQ